MCCNKGICRSSALCSRKYIRITLKTYIVKQLRSEIKLIINFICFILVFQSFSAPSLTPDDDVFKHLALTYSTNHAKMSKGVSCRSSQTAFKRVIIPDRIQFVKIIFKISLVTAIAASHTYIWQASSFFKISEHIENSERAVERYIA